MATKYLIAGWLGCSVITLATSTAVAQTEPPRIDARSRSQALQRDYRQSNQPQRLNNQTPGRMAGAQPSDVVFADSGQLAETRTRELLDRLAGPTKTRSGSTEPPTSSSVGGVANSETIDELLRSGPKDWTSREGLGGSLQVMLMVSVMSLAPAILLMTTCYVRIVVVLGLLRQALGTGQLPPTQVLTSIALFMTLFVMTPVWSRVYTESVKPYTQEGSTMTLEQAWEAGVAPVRDFMSRQIALAKNHDDVHLFYQYYNPGGSPATSFEEVPLRVLLPAYMLSELKTAFLMGFMIFLPFLIIDLVVASVTISMGMMMLPPAMISLPFKILLFVLVDGWHLVVGMLLESFGPIG